MNYYIDTEFYEDGKQVHLISIGIVCEDGRELYHENSEFDWSIVPKDHWIQSNVLPYLSNYTNPTAAGRFAGVAKPRSSIAQEVYRFVNEGAVFYGYYADYDWVVLCQLFGRMVDLPESFPMFCMDLKQMMVERGLDNEWKQKHCPDPQNEHHALADARWNKSLHEHIMIHDANRNTFRP